MARFRYKMQSILNIKEKLETQAKQEFGIAKQALDVEEDKLNELINRKIDYENSTRDSLTGSLSVRDIRDNQTAIRTMDEFIRMQRLQVKLASDALNRASDKLKEAMMERKAQEVLKQKAFEEFLREENKAELKEIDQLTSYTYSKNMREEISQQVYANEE